MALQDVYLSVDTKDKAVLHKTTSLGAASEAPCRKLMSKRGMSTHEANVNQASTRGQNEQTSQRPSDSAVTATLFLVCAVFMLLLLPDSLLEFCVIYGINLFDLPVLDITLWSQVLFNVYFVINPLLYYFSNKYFQCYVNNLFRKSAI